MITNIDVAMVVGCYSYTSSITKKWLQWIEDMNNLKFEIGTTKRMSYASRQSFKIAFQILRRKEG
jgi:hypothetical protein